jgi:hypothetical protein
MTKAQRHKLLQDMRQDSIRMLGEPSASDELLGLLEPINDFIDVELKGIKSRSPKTRARAERRMMEIGGFLFPLMESLCPLYLRTMWKIEHALKDVQSVQSRSN